MRTLLHDSQERDRLFKKTYLLDDTSMDVVLGISFLSLNNSSSKFDIKKLNWRLYTAIEILPTVAKISV